METQSTTYPLLTLEKLSLVERRIDKRRADLKDFELIQHYLISIGFENQVKETFQDYEVLSLEEAFEVIKYDGGYAAAGLSGAFLGMIICLKRRVLAGQKIY